MRHPPFFFCWKSLFLLFIRFKWRWGGDLWMVPIKIGVCPTIFRRFGLKCTVNMSRQAVPSMALWVRVRDTERDASNDNAMRTEKGGTCEKVFHRAVQRWSLSGGRGKADLSWDFERRFITYQDPIRPGPRPHFTLNLISGSHILHLNYTSHSCLIYWLWAPY